MKPAYDVIVVGAGPAGSVAARRAAEAGLDVLLVEKRQEIGAPVRCAEAIGAALAQEFIEIDQRWIDATITSFSITNSRGQSVKLPPAEPTVVVNRKLFDLQLALNAARAGADVRTSTAAVGLLIEDEVVCGVKLTAFGVPEAIRCRLVVAADGVESQVARWAGLKSAPSLADYYTGIEFLLGGLGGDINPQVCEYHLDQRLAPGGYLWVFPKGPDTANVGLVLAADRADKASALSHLEKFVDKKFTQRPVLSVMAGGIPVTGALPHMVTDGLVVVGDAAHQADPLTAGGINLGMIGADMAMQVAAPAVKAGDVSSARLKQYENLWRERFGKMHAALYKIRKIISRMEPDRLDALVEKASRLPIEKMSLGQVVLALLKNDPILLLEASALITTGLILK